MFATILIDNRVRVGIGAGPLPGGVVLALKAACEHDNPAFHKLERLGVPTWGEKRVVRTWRHHRTEEGEWLSFPRGALPRVREALAGAGVDWEERDQRQPGLPADIPDHRVALYPFQRRLEEAALGAENCILRAATGCIVGAAKVVINRAGKGASMRLDHAVRMFNGGEWRGPKWDPNIPTFVRAPMPDGTVRLARVLGARASGVKPVYSVRTASGLSLEATACHRFLTPFGWRRLDGLSIGDYLIRDEALGGRPVPGGPKRKKPWYKLRVCREHPFAGRRGLSKSGQGWTVAEHRLVAEARENGLSLDEFMEAVGDRRPGLKFLDPKVYAVHHSDENPRNNAPENLEVLTHEEHRAAHRRNSVRNISAKLVPDQLVGVEYAGEKETYDLEVDRAEAFMANDIAVHNSGKTEVGLALIGRLKLPSVVLVHNRGLAEQWRRRAVASLGIPLRELGKIGGGTWRVGELTIAMHMSLAKAFGRDDPRALKLADETGLVLFDEVHLASAKSYFAAVDPFRARYRVGISADERRRDGKEFLTHDLFGAVVAEAGREQLIDAGFVLDVEVRVLATRFTADWYGGFTAEADEESRDYKRLMDEMSADDARTGVAIDAALAEAARGEQVVMMAHRREHCRLIDQRLAAHGVRTGFLVGDAPKEFDATVAALARGDVRVAVGTYQAVGTGIDMPSVGVGVCVTPVAANEQNFNQVRGRFCRTAEGKSSARIYYLLDRALPFGDKHLRNLKRWNRTVSEPDGSGGWAPLRSSRGRHKRSA